MCQKDGRHNKRIKGHELKLHISQLNKHLKPTHPKTCQASNKHEKKKSP
jgi:hypothetical protein